MDNWARHIQDMLDEIDKCIRSGQDERLTLKHLEAQLGYSAYYISRKFRDITGMQFRDYLRQRNLAFAVKQLRDTDVGILDIALAHGFSSHEAFSRSFRESYGISPSEYRRSPRSLALRTLLRPFDCYLASIGGGKMNNANEVKTYFVIIPAHKFLHIRNYESIGYWDFWQKQAAIPGQDCDTICGLLHSIPDKLDDIGSGENNSGSGQIMAYINAPTGRICSWGIPLAECYGVRLPADYSGPVPGQMLLMDVPEGEYLVFEHGPFDYATENVAVEQQIEQAMRGFDYSASGCALDMAPGRIMYFYHDEKRFWKYVRPVVRLQ